MFTVRLPFVGTGPAPAASRQIRYDGREWADHDGVFMGGGGGGGGGGTRRPLSRLLDAWTTGSNVLFSPRYRRSLKIRDTSKVLHRAARPRKGSSTARRRLEGPERRDSRRAAARHVRASTPLTGFARSTRLPVIVITAFAATETAIQAMKRGAFEYLLKPLDLGVLRTVLGKAIEQDRVTHVRALLADEEEPEDVAVDRIVGRSPSMQEIYKEIGRAASQDVTVLILGESGTGKELVARAIYQHGLRSERPFLAINCAAILETLLEAELFGHERGPSPELTAVGSASSNRPTAARSSSTRSATCRVPPRRRCSESSRTADSNGSGAATRSRPMSG